MAWIKPERLRHALHNLSEWRKSVNDQGSKHLLPLLALLEKGAGSYRAIHFDETPHEFEFWDKYFRLSDGNASKPYFNPVTLRRAEKGFPHSNAATIRKNTFELKWRAAQRIVDAQGEHWALLDTYADIFRDKVLTKSEQITRIPVLDLAVILFRNTQFNPPLDAASIEKLFRTRFPQEDEDYRKLFAFENEPSGNLFVEQEGKPNYDEVILKSLSIEDPRPSSAPVVSGPTVITDADDPVLLQVKEILTLGTSGIIFKGPPGTGKTYYAQRVAETLVKDKARDIFRVQFHPSYGYEDFVEGFKPDSAAKSGFSIVTKTFMCAAKRAAEVGDNYVVLIIDEINRGDPARVFGELLTYLERSYRKTPFTLPFSGETFSIPEKLLLIGTMNPHDRSVSHVDAAFIRRFDHIDILPSREIAEALLEKSGGFDEREVSLIGDWFDAAQRQIPIGLGHSFFADIASIDDLKLVWRYRIRPTAEALMDLDESRREGFVQSFEGLLRRLEGVESDT